MLPSETVKNIRYGLATNSSSTHSIIHNSSIATMENDGKPHNTEYGWNYFTAKTKADRAAYMMQQLMYNLPSYFQEVIEKICDYENGERPSVLNGYIDHDSAIALPRMFGYDDGLNMAFFNEYFDYITNNYFVILGGNDNDEESHDLECEGDRNKSSYAYEFKCGDKAYKNGNYWVVMNKDRKMRISFTGEEPVADEPELIDLKITDYCDIGCSFCYQGSTEDGKHASLDILKKIIDLHAYKKSIEFAIGGGEPTLHPDFPAILKKIGDSGSIANFTTKSVGWMYNPDILEAVKKYVSGVAYSPDDIRQVVEFVSQHDKKVGDDVALYLHIIPELWTDTGLSELRDTVEDMNKWNTGRKSRNTIHITMLGYKTTGRGKNFEAKKKDNLIEYITSFTQTPVGIDTKIAKDYNDELEKNSIDKKLYTTEEGKFSIYIDGVTEKAYKSSYELEKPIDIIKERYGPQNQYITMRGLENIFSDISK